MDIVNNDLKQFQRNEIPHYERLIRQLGRINPCFFLYLVDDKNRL